MIRWRRRNARLVAAAVLCCALAGSLLAAVLVVAFWPADAAPSQPKAVIIDQLALTDPNPDFVNEAGQRLQAAGYAVDYFRPAEVTVDFYRDLPKRGYKLIIIRSHASQQVFRRDPATGKATEQAGVALFTNEAYSQLTHTDDQRTYRLGIGSYPQLGISDKYFLIGPDFVRASMHGAFKDATVVLMGCGGLSTPDLAQAFESRGVNQFISWDTLVTAKHTDEATQELLRHLVSEAQSPADAVAETMASVGPDPSYGSRLLSRP